MLLWTGRSICVLPIASRGEGTGWLWGQGDVKYIDFHEALNTCSSSPLWPPWLFVTYSNEQCLWLGCKMGINKSRALREILASADQPLRLLPSCFAILPGFAAWERLATIKECAESAREGGGLCPLLATTRRVALRATEEAAAFLRCWREGAILLLLRVLCPRTPHTFSPLLI